MRAVVLDAVDVAGEVREILPEGVDGANELIGTPTLPDTLGSIRVRGVVCFTGMLSNVWTVKDSYPIDYLPRGVPPDGQDPLRAPDRDRIALRAWSR
jgi:hypothetical protein